LQTQRLLKNFYDQVGAKYPEEELVYHSFRGYLRQKFILQYLHTITGSLLDVGCNRGGYLLAYANGPRYGIDLSLPVLQAIPVKDGLHLLVADAARLSCFRPGIFDQVLCSEVLEHCPDPLAVFRGIAHVLRPGGQALITTPNYGAFRPEWIDLGVLQEYGVQCDSRQGYFHTAFHPEELAALARQSGLQPVQYGTLEKEVKYAAKLPALLLIIGRFLRPLIPGRKYALANEKFFNTFSFAIYRFCRCTGLEKWLLKFVAEGVRSFLVLRKPEV
jgi:SAM-dependent methyltransferase